MFFLKYILYFLKILHFVNIYLYIMLISQNLLQYEQKLKFYYIILSTDFFRDFLFFIFINI